MSFSRSYTHRKNTFCTEAQIGGQPREPIHHKRSIHTGVWQQRRPQDLEAREQPLEGMRALGQPELDGLSGRLACRVASPHTCNRRAETQTHVQHMVNAWSTPGQQLVNAWSAFGQHFVSTWSTVDQHMARALSLGGQHLVSSWPLRGQHVASTWSTSSHTPCVSWVVHDGKASMLPYV